MSCHRATLSYSLIFLVLRFLISADCRRFRRRNESNFAISADDESWFSATKARLSQFFSERRTSTDWLHRAAVYDILLVFTGLPMAIWLAYRVVGGITDGRSPPIIISILYVYVFFAAIQLFRILFSYSRWVFPKVELDTESGSPLRHRGYLGRHLFGNCGQLFV